MLPPDHVWLAMMRGVMPDFDPDATFEVRYYRYRRYDDKREAHAVSGGVGEVVFSVQCSVFSECRYGREMFLPAVFIQSC